MTDKPNAALPERVSCVTREGHMRTRAQKGVTGLVPSTLGAWAALFALRRAAVQRAGGHPVHHALPDARRAVRGDHQWLLRSFLGNVVACGICKLVESQLLTNDARGQERLQPVARSVRPVVISCGGSSECRIPGADFLSRWPVAGWGGPLITSPGM